MDNNKVNSWMISTVVLALVVGFLIGCDSPRQQVSAQTSSGVTASELEFVLNKFFPGPTDFIGNRLTGNLPIGVPLLLYEVPLGKYLLADQVAFGNGNGSITGQGTLPSYLEDYPVLFYPGDIIEYTRTTSGSPTAIINGYLLNAD